MLLSEAIRKDDRVLTDRSWCPRVGCGQSRPFFGMVNHLVVDHGWGNKQIADWVAEQEKRLGIES